MKTLQQQAREILAKPGYETERYFLRRYHTEEHLRINNKSGMEIAVDSIKQLATDEAYSEGVALDWIWSADDDEFLVAEHVSDFIRSEIERLGIRGLKFSVENAGTRNSLRIWKIEVAVSGVEGEILIFDVRGVKSLLQQVHNAFLSEA
ncbi:hypothetical protein CL689_03805 [Candidatus Saccharibacteria bacterium]|nr:hypothetical protein [Candidatus Saccharibacteria bacterium]|tara:strand:+ start:113 stop:559 length:447 start_codon:yes stop_codon:yes gene_type:complete